MIGAYRHPAQVNPLHWLLQYEPEVYRLAGFDQSTPAYARMKDTGRNPIRRASIAASFLAALLQVGNACAAAESPAFLTPVRTFELSPGFNNAWGIAFDSDARFLAAENAAGDVEIWDLTTGMRTFAWPAGSTPRGAPELITGRPAGIAFLPSGDLLVCRGTNLAIHNRNTGRAVRTFPPVTESMSGITVTRDGTGACALLAETLPAKLVFWDLVAGRTIDGLPLQNGRYYIGGVRQRGGADFLVPGISRNFGWGQGEFITGDEQSRIERWNLRSARMEARVDRGVQASRTSAVAAAGPDHIAAVENELSLYLYDRNLLNGTVLLPAPPTGDSSATALHIRALEVSGNGSRIAVGGMRRGARPAVFAPRGEYVIDIPIHGEVQVWDVGKMKLASRLMGAIDEKFLQIGMDASGRRVVAAAAGVTYTRRMLGAEQQARELNPPRPARVSAWELPLK